MADKSKTVTLQLTDEELCLVGGSLQALARSGGIGPKAQLKCERLAFDLTKLLPMQRILDAEKALQELDKYDAANDGQD